MRQPQETEAVDEALWKFHERNRRERFFGVIELHYQDGQIVRIKKQEVFLPKDMPRLAAE